MSRILVIYHSQTGRTQKMAESTAKGARSIKNVEVVLKRAGEAT
ncbi:MAG: flavodoxin, partial [Deltaproteobacteria bacterium]|nr:flavodoxin [Deltaproteobacteria bacterium]